MPKINQYNREAAVNYALKWAYMRNPKYYDFTSLGGDCTNFASQCLYAGSKVMNYTPTHGWYYSSANDRSASWTGVNFLFKFLVENNSRGVFAKVVPITQIQIGDVIQLGNSDGHYYHSLVVSAVGTVPQAENILICTHSFNAENRPLNSYDYSNIRYLHIEGIYI